MKVQYPMTYLPAHLKASKSGMVQTHTLVAEKALGKLLPPKAQVHHIDGNRLNYKNCNLVICPNQGYHRLLHLRKAALEATGSPHSRRCVICKQWGIPDETWRVGKETARHKKCHTEYEKTRIRGGFQHKIQKALYDKEYRARKRAT